MVDEKAQDNDSDSSGSSLSFDSLPSLDATNAAARTEYVDPDDRVAIELRGHVEDTIVRLHGYALQIDRAAAKHRQERLKLYQQKDETKLDYDAYKTIGLFRGAKIHFNSASEKIQERMADSLARRRVRFDYLERHQKKRARNLSQNQQPSLPIASNPMTVLQERRPGTPSIRDQGVPTVPFPPLGRPQKDQQTFYSETVNTKLEMGSVVRQQKRVESVISLAQEHPDFLPPPKVAGSSFRCPYCRLDFRASEAQGAPWM